MCYLNPFLNPHLTLQPNLASCHSYIKWFCHLTDLVSRETDTATVISSLQDRLGRLLLTATKESLRLEDPFDSRLEVQFIMPYYLGALCEVAKRDEGLASSLAKMVHHLMLSYEQQLHSWKTGKYSWKLLFPKKNPKRPIL
jgi:hypothetical protein